MFWRKEKRLEGKNSKEGTWREENEGDREERDNNREDAT